MLYKICEYEDNGYHDSYFYGTCYDNEINKLVTKQFNSTAHAGGDVDWWVESKFPTPEVVELARNILEEEIYKAIKKQEHIDVNSPSIALLTNGTEVELTKVHKSYIKLTKDCLSCSGTGKWINPRNDEDVRICFGCNGLGTITIKNYELEGNGKRKHKVFGAGTIGSVISQKSYGTFYRNGYNRPGRSNTTVKISVSNGSIISVPAEKLKLAREPMFYTELIERALRLSFYLNWVPIIGCKAWLTSNFALACAKKNNMYQFNEVKCE